MGCYVLAIGGTGNKILESIVYAAAADAFYTIAPDGRQLPLDQLRLLSVDVDAACGNTTRAGRAAESYEQVRRAFEESRQLRRGFHTKLELRRWNMNLSRRATSVSRLTENHARDRLLSRTLFSKTEASLEYSEGFRGHPDLGVLFFSDLLGSLEDLRAAGQPDEMNAMLDQMEADLNAGQRVKVVLCGSIFGGTGASGIPALARFLHQRFIDRLDRFELASMLMLPYYKVPPSSHNEELEIVVKSADFPDKARTALQYYGMTGMIRSGEDDRDGVFDAMYLLGLPPEAFVQTRIYSTGSQSQENDAHMLEWLATRCISAFLRTPMRGGDAHNMDCYYYQWHTPDFCWQSFDSDSERYRIGYGGLLKAAALFFGECYPPIRNLVSGGSRDGRIIGYCAPYFSQINRMNASQRDQLEKLLSALYQFFAFYANWMVQLTRTIPPTMRPRLKEETLQEEAAAAYQQLILKRAQLQMTDPASAGYDSLAADRALFQSECDRLLPLIGGESWLEMLVSARQSGREQLSHQDQLVADQEEALHRLTHQERNLTSPDEIARQQERLSALRLLRDEYALRLHLTEEDARAAVRADLPGHYPAPASVRQGDVPENGLLNADLMNALSRLLIQYGMGPEERDPDAVSRCSLKLQKKLSKLILSPVPDRRTTPYAIAALGGGSLKTQTPGGVIAAFTATLLAAVMEDRTL
ncbi:MAG: hypothetical protein IJ041_08560 [Clostridia bacterium]|nr:hypothetical protein [Clostridia bacterium]